MNTDPQQIRVQVEALLADLPRDLDAGQALGWVKGGADRGLLTTTSERQGRAIDHDQAASMEKKKQEGYF